MARERISKHISIYLGQFFSLISILSRLSIIFSLLVFPLLKILGLISNQFIVYAYLSIFYVSIIFHLFHYWEKISSNFYILFMLGLILVWFFAPIIFFDLFFFWCIFYVGTFHVILGFLSVLSDYSINNSGKLYFYNFFFLNFIISTLLCFFFLASWLVN